MSEAPAKASVRIRLNERLHYDVGLRAKEKSVPRDQYAAALLRYAVLEKGVLTEASGVKVVEEKGGQELFVAIGITQPFRELLEGLSESSAVNIATFCGRLVEAFIDRFERDPRDFHLLPSLDLALEGREHVEEKEVRELVRACAEANPGVKSGYMATWAFSRLRIRIQKVLVDGKETTLTPAIITGWLK